MTATESDPFKRYSRIVVLRVSFFFFQAEDGIRDVAVTGVQTCALPICAEGFLPDARVGRIRDAMTPYLAREDYGAGLTLGVDLIAQAFAREFGFTLTGDRKSVV